MAPAVHGKAGPTSPSVSENQVRQPRTLAKVLLIVAALPGAALVPPAPLAAQPADTTHISRQPLFTTRDLWVLGAFTAATAISFPFDKSFAERLQRKPNQENRFFHHSATFFRDIGNPGALIIGTSMYAVGRLAHVERMADLGLHGTEALLVGAGVATMIKYTVGRARPYKDIENPRDFSLGRGLKSDDYRSFPSGHSVAGFAAASAVVSETNRWWPKSTWYVAPVMYGGAALIAASRMYNNKHWASDVLVGAAIGTFAGTKIVRYHHSHPDNRVDKWLLSASISPASTGGYALSWSLAPR